MKFFIEMMNYIIWNTVKNDLFVPSNQVNNVVLYKPVNLCIKEDEENMQYNLKAKIIITISLGMNDISVFHTVTLLKKVEPV